MGRAAVPAPAPTRGGDGRAVSAAPASFLAFFASVDADASSSSASFLLAPAAATSFISLSGAAPAHASMITVPDDASEKYRESPGEMIVASPLASSSGSIASSKVVRMTVRRAHAATEAFSVSTSPNDRGVTYARREDPSATTAKGTPSASCTKRCPVPSLMTRCMSASSRCSPSWSCQFL